MNLSELKPNPRNPRKITDKKLKALKKSMEEFGDLSGIVFNTRTGNIVGGHQRVAIFNQAVTSSVSDGFVEALGHKFTYREVDWDENKEKAANIAANKGAGEWDWDQLGDWFKELDTEKFDLDLTMFDEDERKRFFVEPTVYEEGLTDPDSIPEQVETRCKLGDLWLLGNHRLLCGDSTDSLLVERIMGGEKADMVFTDPPYRQETQGGGNTRLGASARKLGKKIEHLCDFSPSGFLNVLPLVFQNQKMNAYIFCNKDLVPDYLNWAIDCGFSFNILFWKKPNPMPLADSHRPDVEYLLLFRKSAIWNNSLEDVNYSRCLEFKKEPSKDHPTVKPVDLIANELRISSNPLGIVVDLFLGSGTTLIACEKTKRKCYGMEIDPKYCDVIIERWEKFTGKTANLHTGG